MSQVWTCILISVDYIHIQNLGHINIPILYTSIWSYWLVDCDIFENNEIFNVFINNENIRQPVASKACEQWM